MSLVSQEMDLGDGVLIKKIRIVHGNPNQEYWWFIDKPARRETADRWWWCLRDDGWHHDTPKRFSGVFEAYTFWLIAQDDGLTDKHFEYNGNLVHSSD